MRVTVLISHLQEGISDGPDAGTLPRSAVGPIEVGVLDRALRLCISHHKELDGIHELNPRFVLAQAWSETRLAAARERSAQEIRDDAIDVTGIQFPGLPTYYLVTDGMHRTVAARLARKLTIRADVAGCYICDPQALKLVSDVPWHLNDGQWCRSTGRESDAVIDLLISFGVESLNRWQWWFRRVPKTRPARNAHYDPTRLT